MCVKVLGGAEANDNVIKIARVYVYPQWNHLFLALLTAIKEEEMNFGLDAIDECLNLADESL